MKFVGKANNAEEIKEEEQNKEIYLSDLISLVVESAIFMVQSTQV